MPPHLRRGSPVSQHKQVLPSAMRLCQCYLCAESNAIDPVKGQFVKGRYLGKEEYKRHRSMETKSGLAPAAASAAALNIEALLPNPTTSLPHSEFDSAASPATASAQAGSTNLKERSPSSSSNIEFSTILDSIFLSLDSQSVDDVFEGWEPMFLHPPVPGAPASPPPDPRDQEANSVQVNVGPFALFSTFAPNSRIIGYEEWLLQSSQLIHEHGLRHRERRVRARSTIALRRITSDLEEIERRKREEWERQRLAFQSEETAPAQDGCSVDSGLLFRSGDFYG